MTPLSLTNEHEVRAKQERATILPVTREVAQDFVAKHHYLKSGGRAPWNHGLFRNGELVGVIQWMMASQGTAKNFPEPNNVLSLSRLVLVNAQPNDASWFISRSVKLLPPRYHTLVTFTDPAVGHSGTIYRAAGWTELGETTKAKQWAIDGKWIFAGKLKKPQLLAMGATVLREGQRLMFGLHRQGGHLPLTHCRYVKLVQEFLRQQPLNSRLQEAIEHIR